MKTGAPRLTKTLILRTLKKHDDALKQYCVKRIGRFGSYARGDQTANSDIDFLVEFDNPTYENYYGLCVYLEGLFRRNFEVLTPDAVDSIRADEVAHNIRESVVFV